MIINISLFLICFLGRNDDLNKELPFVSLKSHFWVLVSAAAINPRFVRIPISRSPVPGCLYHVLILREGKSEKFYAGDCYGGAIVGQGRSTCHLGFEQPSCSKLSSKNCPTSEMPKDRRVNSSSFDRARVSPYSCSLKGTGCNDDGSSSPLVGDEREWEESRCPICMEHPHNAVLLLCSSQEKGCRPFMCDTSYRHSNCLDQYRKSFASSTTTEQKSDLVCPLCRGCITGWVVKEPARRFMNLKRRCCSLETCNFSGNYTELRKHARREHPSDRPSETNAIRQSNWTTLERELDINDALVHQLDFEDAWDGWPSWDELGDADFWSDGTFFDFPMEEISDFDDDVFGSLPLSDSTLFTSLETELSDSDFSGEYDSLHRRSTADNSSPSSNDRSPSSSSRPTLMYHRENDPAGSESSPTSHNHGGGPMFISRSTSSYPLENNPTISRSNPRSDDGEENSFSISRSTARYDRVNDSTYSRSRSNYTRENHVTYSRSRSSYRVENASENSRSSRHSDDSPLARQAGSRGFPAFSRRRSP